LPSEDALAAYRPDLAVVRSRPNTLISAGFTVRQIEEFAPAAKEIETMPAPAEKLERPMMSLVAAHKT